jgi:hypothetical protein
MNNNISKVKRAHNNGFKKGCTPWNKGMDMSQEYKDKLPKRIGPETPHWKGGKVFSNGYILVLDKNHPYRRKSNYVREQRLVIEKQINRFLLPCERVHHIDMVKTNNVPSNLIAFISESAHQRFHQNPNNVKPEEIIFDGRNI